MKIKATCVQIREYEVDPENYPEGSTNDEILAIDKQAAEDDPALFFDYDYQTEIIVEIVGET